MPGYPRPSRLPAVSLRELAAVAGARLIPAHGGYGGSEATDAAVSGITHDSTAVRPGDLYVALAGARCHGIDFARDAVGRGAVGVLTDEHAGAGGEAANLGVALLVAQRPRAVLGDVASAIYGHPSARLTLIGLTGTAGKTSTAYLIEAGLRAAGHTTGLIGTVETRIADTVVTSVRTTPEATDLHALLAVAVQQSVTAVVMEVSSHALSYGRVGGVRFAVGGWTNFGLDHLDFHADVDDYFQAKARLFDGRCGREVFNLDDPALRALADPGRVTFSASGDPAASWRAVDVRREGFVQRFTAVGPGPVEVAAGVALPGRHNVANALLAIACLVEAGVDALTAAAGVASCLGVPGRLERVAAPGPVLGVVDYAHKPDAIVAALAALRDVGDGRLICVIGAGGDRDRGKRRLMGEAAARGADIVIVTDDNPRTENPAQIRAEVRAGAVGSVRSTQDGSGEAGPRPAILEVATRREAIVEAVRLAEPGDVVALLGKGHETGQEVEGVVLPFDDRLELTAALTERFAEVRA